MMHGDAAAPAGPIAGAAFVLGRRAIVDLTTLAVAGATMLCRVRARRVPEPLLIVAAGTAGVALAAPRGA